MPTIEADIDRYGTLARASYLADYLELLALTGIRCTFPQLAEMIADRFGLKREILLLPEEDPEDEDTAAAFIDQARECILERGDILGAAYPFEIDDIELRISGGADPDESVYVALLCVTLVHAYSLDAGLNVEEVFEALVAEALTNLELVVGNVGETSRQNAGNFVRTLDALASSMDLPLDPSAAPRRRRANDAGADILAFSSWGDHRTGRWSAIGQVTCGDSDSWVGKLFEPKPLQWVKFLAETTEPRCFLAVPHHVNERPFRELSANSGRTVIDRLRLAKLLDPLPGVLRDIIACVRASSVQGSEF